MRVMRLYASVLAFAVAACKGSGSGLGDPLDLGLYNGALGFGARSGLDDAVIVFDKLPTYPFDGYICAVSGADMLEPPSTRIFRAEGRRRLTELQAPPGFVMNGAQFVPVLGAGAAIMGPDPSGPVLAAHDGTLLQPWNLAALFPDRPDLRLADAVVSGTWEDWRIVLVDDASQIHVVEGSRPPRLLGQAPVGARIASFDGAAVALAAVVDNQLQVERWSLDDGVVDGALAFGLPIATWGPPMARTANGTPDRFRVVLPDPDRSGSNLVFDVDGDTVRGEGRIQGTAVETRLGSRELLGVTASGGWNSWVYSHPTRLLDDSGQTFQMADPAEGEDFCTGNTTPFYCGGITCQQSYTAALDGDGGVRAYRYVAWWPEGHWYTEVPVDLEAIEPDVDLGYVRVRLAAFPQEGDLALWAWDPGTEVPHTVVYAAPVGTVSEYVNVPRGGAGGADVRLGIAPAGEDFVSHEVTVPGELERATIVVWQERSGEFHAAVWDEALPAPGEVAWSTLAWLGGANPHDDVWSEATLACDGPACTPACVPVAEGGVSLPARAALDADDSVTIASHFGPDGACGGDARDEHTFAAADLGHAWLRVLDGTFDNFGRVTWIDAAP